MLTDDENIIDIQFAVQYNLKSAEDYVFNNRKPDEIVAVRRRDGDPRSRRQEQDGLRAVRGPRADRRRRREQLMQEMLDRYSTGINVQKVTLQNVQPPEQVQAAFDDAVKAGQDRERLKNEGQAYANDVVPRARGTASRLLEEAERLQAPKSIAARRGRRVALQQVLAEYAKAPGVTRDRLYLDMMQSVLGNSSKVLVDQKGGSNLLYLPLDKLMQQGAAAAGAGRRRRRAPPRAPDARAAGDARAAARARRPAQPRARRTTDEAHDAAPRAHRRAAARRVAVALHRRPAQVRDQVPAGRDRRDASRAPGLYFKVPLLQNVALLRQAQPDARQSPSPTASPRRRRSRCWSTSS